MLLRVEDYTVGRTTRRGQPCEPRARHPVVHVVRPEHLEKIMGCRRGTRLTEHLRAQRDRGVLVCAPGRLTSKVRGMGRVYVFRIDRPEKVPVVRAARVGRA